MISDQATACPQCGCPTQQDTALHGGSNRWLYAIIGLLALALLAGGVVFFMNKGKTKENNPQKKEMAEVGKDTETAAPSHAKAQPPSSSRK